MLINISDVVSIFSVSMNSDSDCVTVWFLSTNNQNKAMVLKHCPVKKRCWTVSVCEINYLTLFPPRKFQAEERPFVKQEDKKRRRVKCTVLWCLYCTLSDFCYSSLQHSHRIVVELVNKKTHQKGNPQLAWRDSLGFSEWVYKRQSFEIGFSCGSYWWFCCSVA